MDLRKPHEKVVADNGYSLERCMTSNFVQPMRKEIHVRTRTRYESCNARLKDFRMLGSAHSHSVHCHSAICYALAMQTLLKLGEGGGLNSRYRLIAS